MERGKQEIISEEQKADEKNQREGGVSFLRFLRDPDFGKPPGKAAFAVIRGQQTNCALCKRGEPHPFHGSDILRPSHFKPDRFAGDRHLDVVPHVQVRADLDFVPGLRFIEGRHIHDKGFSR